MSVIALLISSEQVYLDVRLALFELLTISLRSKIQDRCDPEAGSM
jgi:hypothetical protein